MKLKSTWGQVVLAVTLFAAPIAGMAVTPTVVQAEEASAAPVLWMKEITAEGYITGAVVGQNGDVFVYGRYEKGGHDAPAKCYLAALTPDGKQKWYLDLDVEGVFGSVKIDGEGTLHFVTYNFATGARKLHTVAADGTKKWSYSRGPYSNLLSPQMEEDGTLYVGNTLYSTDGTLTAFAPSGKIKWDYPFPGKRMGVPVKIAGNGTIYAMDFATDSLIALNSEGKELWKFAIEGASFIAPAVQQDGSVVIFTSHSLMVLRPDGSVKWKWQDDSPVSEEVAKDSEAFHFIDRDGTIYYPAHQAGMIIAFDADGTKKWEVNAGVDGKVAYVFHERNDVLYVKSGQSVVALNKDGTKLWEKTLTSKPESKIFDPMIGLDGTIYFQVFEPYARNETVAISPDGEIKWRLGNGKTGDSWESAEPLAVAHDGTVYTNVGSKLYAVQGSPVEVILNGQPQTFTQPPVIRGGRTLVPMREIFEAFGCEVTWDQATQTVTAVKGDTQIQLPIGAKTAKINGVDKPLDTGAQLVNDRTMVPVRFVSEALGAQVAWDGETRTISIAVQE